MFLSKIESKCVGSNLRAGHLYLYIDCTKNYYACTYLVIEFLLEPCYIYIYLYIIYILII